MSFSLRLHGLTKVAWLVGSFFVYLADSRLLLLFLSIQAVLLFFGTGAHSTALGYNLRYGLPLIAVFVPVGLLWGQETPEVVLFSLLRIVILATMVVSAFGALRPSELVASMRLLGLPVGPSVAVAVGLRFLPVLVEDVERVALARRARGLEGARHGLSLVRYLLLPVLSISFERADRFLSSLQLKGATSANLTSYLGAPGWRDALAITLLVLEIVACWIW